MRQWEYAGAGVKKDGFGDGEAQHERSSDCARLACALSTRRLAVL